MENKINQFVIKRCAPSGIYVISFAKNGKYLDKNVIVCGMRYYNRIGMNFSDAVSAVYENLYNDGWDFVRTPLIYNAYEAIVIASNTEDLLCW